MKGDKAHIIARLQREILPLQGYKPVPGMSKIDTGLGPILKAFPNNTFPCGAIHECIIDGKEGRAATAGFVTALAGKLMGVQGVAIWIGANKMIFPPALAQFSVEPSNVIFINLEKEKDILWATEEALRCEAITCVVSEVPSINFTASRRLQLAVETSRVTGFVLKPLSKYENVTASICKWKVSSLPSDIDDSFPGVGFPQWNVEILKIRNGLPGKWTVSWYDGRFQHTYQQPSIVPLRKQNTG